MRADHTNALRTPLAHNLLAEDGDEAPGRRDVHGPQGHSLHLVPRVQYAAAGIRFGMKTAP